MSAMPASSAPQAGESGGLDSQLSDRTRLLVFAPHPDDEVLAAGGLMQRVRQRGGQVHVVYATEGDGFPEGVEAEDHIDNPTPKDYRAYGHLRSREAHTVLARLDLKNTGIFLGFPDGGLCYLLADYYADRTKAFESPYTLERRPPPREQVLAGVTYHGEDLRREIERLLAVYAPTLVVIPDAGDEHPDHCATGLFVQEALDRVGRRLPVLPGVYRYVVHFAQWPLDDASSQGTRLDPPAGFPLAAGEWLSFPLSASESEMKRRALFHYESQMLVIGRFLLGFARANELFLPGLPEVVKGQEPACYCDGTAVATLRPAPPPRKPRARKR